ncbi:MAG: hypothetical protein AAGI54_11975 [Planctomycetota bacterium]
MFQGVLSIVLVVIVGAVITGVSGLMAYSYVGQAKDMQAGSVKAREQNQDPFPYDYTASKYKRTAVFFAVTSLLGLIVTVVLLTLSAVGIALGVSDVAG